MDPAGLIALTAVSAEWLVLGWIADSGWVWPAPASGARWGARLLVGAFLVASALLLAMLVALPLTNVPAVLGLAAVLAVALRLATAALGISSPHRSTPFTKPSNATITAWALLTLLLVAALVRASVVPETEWDAFSHWGLKAKAYFLAAAWVPTPTTHEYYPPLVPLLEAWFYAHRGGVQIDQVKAVWAVLGAAFAVCLAEHGRALLAKDWAGPLVSIGILLAATQLIDSFWTGQADLSLTVYLTCSVLALQRWRAAPGRHRGWLIQACVFGAAAALTKYEGVFRVGMVAVALLVDAKLWPRPRPAVLACVIYFLIAAGLAAVWGVFIQLHGIPLASQEHLSVPQWSATLNTVAALLRQFAGIRTGGALLVLAATALVAGRRALGFEPRFLLLVTVGQAFGTFAAFLVASDPVAEVQTSATRLVMQFLPIALLLAAYCLASRLAQSGERQADIRTTV